MSESELTVALEGVEIGTLDLQERQPEISYNASGSDAATCPTARR